MTTNVSKLCMLALYSLASVVGERGLCERKGCHQDHKGASRVHQMVLSVFEGLGNRQLYNELLIHIYART